MLKPRFSFQSHTVLNMHAFKSCRYFHVRYFTLISFFPVFFFFFFFFFEVFLYFFFFFCFSFFRFSRFLTKPINAVKQLYYLQGQSPFVTTKIIFLASLILSPSCHKFAGASCNRISYASFSHFTQPFLSGAIVDYARTVSFCYCAHRLRILEWSKKLGRCQLKQRYVFVRFLNIREKQIIAKAIDWR